MRVWVVLFVVFLASFVGLAVLVNYMRATGGIRELAYREEMRLLPDTFYCRDVVADADYERVSILVETLDYSGTRPPHYVLFVIKLDGRMTKCMPPADYYLAGGKEVWAGEGDGVLRATIPMEKGYYVIVLAQTDNLVGMTTARIRLQGSTRIS